MVPIELDGNGNILNMARRQLTREQRREIIMDQLVETPEMSNRRISEKLGVDHKTVGSVRLEGERRGQIAHVGTVVDTLGRAQPRTKAPARETA